MWRGAAGLSFGWRVATHTHTRCPADSATFGVGHRCTGVLGGGLGRLVGDWQNTIKKGQKGCGVSVEIQNVREGKDRHHSPAVRVTWRDSAFSVFFFFSGFFILLSRYAKNCDAKRSMSLKRREGVTVEERLWPSSESRRVPKSLRSKVNSFQSLRTASGEARFVHYH